MPTSLPTVDTMLTTTPDAVRNVGFEICGDQATMKMPGNKLRSCDWYSAKYNAQYWGGTPFTTLEVMRDLDDKGVPSNPSDPNSPRVDFKKEGLFTPDKPLFDDMIVNNYEEWTVINRSFTDHPFHIHQNHFLLIKINGHTLRIPEWHDTIIVPGAIPQPTGPDEPQPNINDVPYGSITFRILISIRSQLAALLRIATSLRMRISV